MRVSLALSHRPDSRHSHPRVNNLDIEGIGAAITLWRGHDRWHLNAVKEVAVPAFDSEFFRFLGHPYSSGLIISTTMQQQLNVPVRVVSAVYSQPSLIDCMFAPCVLPPPFWRRGQFCPVFSLPKLGLFRTVPGIYIRACMHTEKNECNISSMTSTQRQSLPSRYGDI